MSLELRQRTPSEYLKILRRRIWLIILPIIAVTPAVALVVSRLPDVYESVTLIVVRPSTLPTTVVPTVTEDSLSRQLTSIAQVVTSRSSLEPLVTKYELYKSERLRGEPMESIIDMLRRDIRVEVNTSRNDITNGFNITVHGRDPRTTQAVTAELATKYIDQQTQNTVNSTTSAKTFIDQQVRLAKEELDAVDKQRLDFMQQNVGNLPSEATSLIGQLGGLREQQKALISEVGRLQDRRSALSSSLTLMRKQSQQIKDDVIENTTDPKQTLAYSQLLMRKAQLEGELTHLRQELKEKHPDVIAKQKEVDQVKEREYQTKKGAYDQLLGQQSKINLGREAATQQQGESIEVVDAANLPSKPIAPKRLVLSAMGLAVGFALGLLLTAILEIPRLLTIQSSEDARHYTGLPVLISVPELLTPQEARALPRRRRLLLAAGVAMAIVSIPLLALALRATHVVEFLTTSSGRPS